MRRAGENLSKSNFRNYPPTNGWGGGRFEKWTRKINEMGTYLECQYTFVTIMNELRFQAFFFSILPNSTSHFSPQCASDRSNKLIPASYAAPIMASACSSTTSSLKVDHVPEKNVRIWYYNYLSVIKRRVQIWKYPQLYANDNHWHRKIKILRWGMNQKS